MNTELYSRYNPWWENEFDLKGIYPREKIVSKLYSNLKSGEIIFLTGLRRVGKTTLMKIIIHKLIHEHSIPENRIFYISLDDYLLSNRNILEIIDDFRKIHKIRFEEKIFVFLDEIAYKENFEQQLKNIHDSQNIKIFASSSSTSMLRSKKHFLTGRNIIFEMLPLDFDEYLEFKEIKVKKADESLLDSYFEDFLKTGGLPEYVKYGEIEYIKELVDDIISKDIAAFYRVKNTYLLKDLFTLLMERAGKLVSINKLAKILGLSPDTLRRHLKMFEDTYLVYLMPRYGKPNEKLLSPKKLYAADLGIRTYYTGFRDNGSLFENYVYLKLKHKFPNYVLQNKIEIDFFTEDKCLIEVKYNRELSEKQKELFDKFKAKKKFTINSFRDLMSMKELK